MLKLMLICNDPEKAKHAVASGVDRIFVDLEINGKWERQGHRDTLISGHYIDDIAKVRVAIPDSELLVRLNPLYENTPEEIDNAIDAGADILMLPMFKEVEQVSEFVAYVDGRVRVIPLVETVSAVNQFQSIVQLPGIDEIYIGFNDLHMEMNMKFMFEPLINGMMDKMAQQARDAGVEFGFGGIARMNEGLLSGAIVLSEHVRLGSSSVILSRTFQRPGESLSKFKAKRDFAVAIGELREEEKRLRLRNASETEKDRLQFIESVISVVRDLSEV